MRKRVGLLAAFFLLCACGSDIDKAPVSGADAVRGVDSATTAKASTTRSVGDIPDVRCEVDESVQRLTQAELEAIRGGNWKFNSLVAELAERMPPKEPPGLPDTTNAKDIDWEQAKGMEWFGVHWSPRLFKGTIVALF